MSAFLQQDIDGAGAAVHRPRGAEGKHFVALTQPAADLGFEYRQPLVRTVAFAVDHAHAAQAVGETFVEKIAQYRACLGHGASVQIAFGLYGQLPAAQAFHCAMLQAAAGEEQFFTGFVVAGVKAVGEQVAQDFLLVALAETGARGRPRQAVLDAVVGHGPDRADAGFE